MTDIFVTTPKGQRVKHGELDGDVFKRKVRKNCQNRRTEGGVDL